MWCEDVGWIHMASDILHWRELADINHVCSKKFHVRLNLEKFLDSWACTGCRMSITLHAVSSILQLFSGVPNGSFPRGFPPPPPKKIGCMSRLPHYTSQSLPLRLQRLSADYTKEQVTLVRESFWRPAEFLSTQSGWIVSVEHTNRRKFWRHSLRHPIKTSFLFPSLSSPTASYASCRVGVGGGRV